MSAQTVREMTVSERVCFLVLLLLGGTAFGAMVGYWQAPIHTETADAHSLRFVGNMALGAAMGLQAWTAHLIQAGP